VFRLRAAATVDSFGDPVEGWDVPERAPLRGADVQRGGSIEVDGELRALTTSEARLFAPSALDLTEDDRVEADGELWTVEGPPLVRRGLASSVYTLALLRRAS
jgi:hypothetical protein